MAPFERRGHTFHRKVTFAGLFRQSGANTKRVVIVVVVVVTIRVDVPHVVGVVGVRRAQPPIRGRYEPYPITNGLTALQSFILRKLFRYKSRHFLKSSGLFSGSQGFRSCGVFLFPRKRHILDIRYCLSPELAPFKADVFKL